MLFTHVASATSSRGCWEDGSPPTSTAPTGSGLGPVRSALRLVATPYS